MNYIDVIILVLAVAFAIDGYRKGIIIGLASIAALVLGIYMAVHFSNYLDATLMEHLHPSRKWLPILSFAVTFLLVVLLVYLIAKMVEKVVDIVGMGFLNKMGGALLGIVKGIILTSILLFFLSTIDRKESLVSGNDKKNSLLYPKVSVVFPFLMKEFGGEIRFPSWPVGTSQPDRDS